MTLFTQDPLLRRGAKDGVISEYNKRTQSSDLANSHTVLKFGP